MKNILMILVVLFMANCTTDTDETQFLVLLEKYDVIFNIYEVDQSGDYGQTLDLSYPYYLYNGEYVSRLDNSTLTPVLDSLGIELLILEQQDDVQITFITDTMLRGLQISRISEFINIEF